MTPAECRQPHTGDRTLGLLAGWGRYPLAVAKSLKSLGYRVCCLGVEGHADPRLCGLCDHFSWIGAAKLGRAIRYFHRHRVREATMAGKFHKVLIYQKGAWYRHLPDLKFLRAFYPHFVRGTADRRDDTLLGVIVDVFAEEGILFRPATDFAPHLLVRSGPLSQCQPTAGQQRDIAFGWRMAKEMGALDIGQSVCVKDQAVLAVEAIEGTDRCIRRAGLLCAMGGFTVVKVAKPRQDMRFDVPTVGLRTLRTMLRAGGRVLALEAQRSVLLDAEAFRHFADRHRLAVTVLADETARPAAA